MQDYHSLKHAMYISMLLQKITLIQNTAKPNRMMYCRHNRDLIYSQIVNTRDDIKLCSFKYKYITFGVSFFDITPDKLPFKQLLSLTTT